MFAKASHAQIIKEFTQFFPSKEGTTKIGNFVELSIVCRKLAREVVVNTF